MNITQNHQVQFLLKEGPLTTLSVEKEDILLNVINQENSIQTQLRAGSMKHILNHIQHEPATAAELEAAIETIEDELMPVIPSLPDHRCLISSEPAMKKLVELNSGKDKARLKVTEVERIFNDLVDVAYGTPAKMLEVPENHEFAAVLLFLRELMHHAAYPDITILSD